MRSGHREGVACALGRACLTIGALVVAGCSPATTRTETFTAPAVPRWWKGNTHAHTLWSDGDHFPEAVASWYRRNGYDFLAITDHNTLAGEEKWFRVPPQGPGAAAYRDYAAAFDAEWRDERRSGDTLFVRLKRLDEYRRRMNVERRFLLVPGEEITQYLAGRAVHMNGLNVAAVVREQTGATQREIFEKDLAELSAQDSAARRPVLGVLNHPNFLWSQTAEDLIALPDLWFFEVYNGHPLVNNQGNSLHPGTERLWDIVLTHRVVSGGIPLYGVATDDSHDYHVVAPEQRNPGRGWIMVRAAELRADYLMASMLRGYFYASTGVTLDEIRHDGNRVSLAIRPEPGVTYTTQFIGTLAGFDTTTAAVFDSAGRPVTRRYSADIGRVLAEVAGIAPSYAFRGDELYVRARVVSSKPKANVPSAGEREMAWVQPVRPVARRP